MMQNIIHRFLVTLALLTISLQPMQGRSIRQFLLSKPGEVHMQLSNATLNWVFENYAQGNRDSVVSNLTAYTWLTELDSTHCTIRTEGHSFTAQMLTAGRDTTLMLLTTLTTPQPESYIQFFDRRWRPIPTAKRFVEPKLADFILPNVTEAERQQIRDALPFGIISYTVQGERYDQLVARLHLRSYLTAEDAARLSPYFRDSITYTITPKRFVRKP